MELEPQKTLVTGVHVGYVDTDMVRSLDVPKITPQQAAAAILDGIQDGQTEALVDESAGQFKAALSGPVEGLQLRERC